MSDVKLAILCEHGLFEPHWRSHDRPYRENDTCPGGHLIEGGETVWWCEPHHWNGWQDEDVCLWVRVGREAGASFTDCRMVERFLIPLPNTETTKEWGPDHPSYDEMGQ